MTNKPSGRCLWIRFTLSAGVHSNMGRDNRFTELHNWRLTITPDVTLGRPIDSSAFVVHLVGKGSVLPPIDIREAGKLRLQSGVPIHLRDVSVMQTALVKAVIFMIHGFFVEELAVNMIRFERLKDPSTRPYPAIWAVLGPFTVTLNPDHTLGRPSVFEVVPWYDSTCPSGTEPAHYGDMAYNFLHVYSTIEHELRTHAYWTGSVVDRHSVVRKLKGRDTPPLTSPMGSNACVLERFGRSRETGTGARFSIAPCMAGVFATVCYKQASYIPGQLCPADWDARGPQGTKSCQVCGFPCDLSGGCSRVPPLVSGQSWIDTIDCVCKYIPPSRDAPYVLEYTIKTTVYIVDWCLFSKIMRVIGSKVTVSSTPAATTRHVSTTLNVIQPEPPTSKDSITPTSDVATTKNNSDYKASDISTTPVGFGTSTVDIDLSTVNVNTPTANVEYSTGDIDKSTVDDDASTADMTSTSVDSFSTRTTIWRNTTSVDMATKKDEINQTLHDITSAVTQTEGTSIADVRYVTTSKTSSTKFEQTVSDTTPTPTSTHAPRVPTPDGVPLPSKPPIGPCACVCRRRPHDNDTNQQKEKFTKKLLDKMADVKNNETSNRRQREKLSAPDERPVSRGLGLAAGLFLGAVVLGLVVSDVSRVWGDVKRGCGYVVGYVRDGEGRYSE